jgi:hypothetical protein
VEPGKIGTLTFTYRLPQSIADQITAGQYNLYLQKQPGSSITALDLDLELDSDIKSQTDTSADKPDSSGSRFSSRSGFEMDRSISLGF